MDAGGEQNILNMYELVQRKKAEVNAKKQTLRPEIDEQIANEIDAEIQRITADMNLKAEAKPSAKPEKKDNQVNCCRLF